MFHSKTKNKTLLPNLIFKNAPVSSADSTKHLGLILDKRLSFDHLLKVKFLIENRGIGLITRLRKYLPCNYLLCVYKSFVIPHLDYGDILFDNPTNDSFTQKLESIQYNECLAITGSFRGTSRDKIYQ